MFLSSDKCSAPGIIPLIVSSSTQCMGQLLEGSSLQVSRESWKRFHLFSREMSAGESW